MLYIYQHGFLIFVYAMNVECEVKYCIVVDLCECGCRPTVHSMMATNSQGQTANRSWRRCRRIRCGTDEGNRRSISQQPSRHSWKPILLHHSDMQKYSNVNWKIPIHQFLLKVKVAPSFHSLKCGTDHTHEPKNICVRWCDQTYNPIIWWKTLLTIGKIGSVPMSCLPTRHTCTCGLNHRQQQQEWNKTNILAFIYDSSFNKQTYFHFVCLLCCTQRDCFFFFFVILKGQQQLTCMPGIGLHMRVSVCVARSVSLSLWAYEICWSRRQQIVIL